MFSPSQLLFFLAFFSLFFLLMVFGETQYGIYFMAALTTVFVLYRKKIDLSTFLSPTLLAITIPLVAVTCFSVLSLFVTQSIPLTMYRMIFSLFSFLCFVFFLSVDKNFLPTKMLIYGFCLVACVLMPLALFFFFFPDFAKHLPDLNLLVANYGHNHAAIYFLFVLPLSISIWIENRHHRASMLPFLCVLVGLFFSFARVVTFLTCVELFFVLWFFTHRGLLAKKHWLFLVPFIALFCLFTLFSFSPQLAAANHCNVPVFQKQLCKSITTESRPEYWQQALAGIKAKPLTGWGGGTFSIVSQRFQSNPYHFSVYPHNEYLEFFVEYGVIVGSVFVFFFLAIAQKTLHILVQKNIREQFFLSLAILSLCVDAFFDYNWNYLAIWSVFLIAVALAVKKKSGYVPSKILKQIITIFLFLLVLTITIWTGAYTVSTIMWSKGNRDLAIRIFPFADWRVEEMVGDEKTDPQTLLFLLSLYQNNSTVVQKYLQNSTDPKTRIFWFQKMLVLEPRQIFTRYQLLHEYIQDENWLHLISGLKTAQTFCQTPPNSCSDEMSSAFEEEVTTAAKQLLITDPQIAIQIYQSLPRKNDMWKYYDVIVGYDLAQAKIAFHSHQWTEVTQKSQHISSLADWGKWEVWKTFLPLYKAEFDRALLTGNISQTTQLLQSWSDLLRAIHVDGEDNKILFMYNSNTLHRLQNLANTAIRQQRWADAELTLQILSQNFGSDYWAVAQLGNYYYLRGDLQKATQTYQACIAKYSQKSTFCTEGLRSIHNNWNDGVSRYWQASQKLLQYQWN